MTATPQLLFGQPQQVDKHLAELLEQLLQFAHFIR